jgi:hypothetical protein
MKTSGVLSACVVLGILAGCHSSVAPEAMRTRAQVRETYLVPGNYQAVYREILHRARGWINAEMFAYTSDPYLTYALQEEIWTDLNTAALTFVFRARPNTIWTLDLEARGQGQTIVRAYFAEDLDPRVIRAWMGREFRAQDIRDWIAELKGVRQEGTTEERK